MTDQDRLRTLLAARIEAGRDRQPTGIPRRPDPQAPAPLSATQANLWFWWQYDPANVSYHMPLVLRLRGRVDPAALAQAVRDLAERHEVLRSVVEVHAGEPVSVVRPAAEVPVSVSTVAPNELDARLEAEARRPFALDAEPPVRAVVFSTNPDEAVLALTVHHLASDGWSQDVLVRDLIRLYAARVGLAAAPEPPRLQYADAVAWQAAQLSGDRLAGKLDWWADQLRGMPSRLDLPVDRPETPDTGWASGVVPLAVPPATAARVREIATATGASTFMVLMAAMQALLARVAGTDDVVVGVPEAGRHHPDTEALAGCFLNVLVIRGDVAGDPTGRELVDRVRQRMLGAFANAEVPLERIVARLDPDRRVGGPLYQVQLNVHGAPAPAEPVPGLDVEADYTVVHSAKFDLNVDLADQGAGGLAGTLEYRAGLFDAATAQRLVRWYLAILDGLALDAPVGAIALEPVSGPLLAGLCENRPDTPLHRQFERWADERPDAVAVVGPDTTYSYAELERQANRVAHRLLAAGVRPGEAVGVLLEPGAAFAAALLGALKAGAGYLPLEVAHPAARIADMLAAAEARVLLTTADLADRAGDRTVLAMDDPATLADQPAARPDLAAGPDDLLHVIFTSGSTGAPKGIAVAHRGVANCVAGMVPLLPAGTASFAVVSTVSADLGLACVYGALTTGGTLHLLDRETATDPAAFAAYLAAHPVDAVKLVPSHLSLLAQHGDLAAVLPRRLVIFGGEAVPWSLVDRIRAVRPDLAVQTHYGPTESSMFSLVCDTAAVPETAAVVPLGAVLPNIGVHVLDRAGRPLPAGVPGELALVGPGVSRGYVGPAAAQNADRFVPDPAGGTGRCYRTGDLVRVRPDGTVDFLGRVDDQVKVRGHRIELGEVVAALRAVPGVADAVVLPDGEAHERRLVGWLVPAADALDVATVRAALRDSLPDYMVPVAFTVLDRLPLNRNGKVDRAALPRPSTTPAAEWALVAPRTPTERAVAQVWAGVLGLEQVGVHDDFFALGGHSFAATRAVGRLREALSRDLPLRLLFERPVLADFAAALDALDPATGPRAAAAIGRRTDPEAPAPLSASQAWWWLLSQLEPGRAAYNVPAVLRLSGPADPDALLAAVRDVARRHPVLRSVIREIDGQPAAVPMPAELVPAALRRVAPGEEDAVLRAEAGRPFALDAEPPMRAAVVEVSDAEHVLALTFHHSAVDAWTLELILADLAACYAARLGLADPPAPPALDHADYATWAAAATDDGIAWWADRLADPPPPLELGTGSSGPDGVVPATVPADLAARVRAAAAGTGTTPFMVLLAGWQALLGRLSGGTDVAVGVPVSGRYHPEVDAVVGCFANTVVLRTAVTGELTGRQLLARVREVALDGFGHAEVPIGAIVERLDLGRDDPPLFQVMLNFITDGPRQRAGSGRGGVPDFAGLTTSGYDRPVDAVDLDLNLTLLDAGTGYQGGLAYRGELFGRATAERIVGWYTTLLAGLLEDLDAPIGSVELVEPAERAELLAAGTGAALPAGAPATVVQAVLAQAAARPDAVAVEGPDGKLSYAELAEWSARVAGGLRAAGVGDGEPVAVCVPRDHLVPVAFLAVWRAGAAYLPLDPDHPADRLRALATDAGARVVLTRGAAHHQAAGTGATVLDLDDLLAAPVPADLPAVRPDGLAYVIYTSGSTGRPKGVEVEHGSLAAHVIGYGIVPGVSERDTMLAAAPLSFDQATEEIWTPLVAGARCLVVERECVLDGYALAERIGSAGVTVADFSVMLARMLLAANWKPRPEMRVWTGTEAPDPALVRALLPQVAELWNTYGPTEATVMSTVHRVTEADAANVPIGLPVPGERLYVIDGHGALAPRGVAGELWIGGVGVARGYRDRPEADAAAFVADPFVPGQRCYRTGDLVRWNAAGTLEFVGRRDHQVKIRGHRIELGEIESTLHEHPAVRQAVVTVHGTGAASALVGYLCPSDVDGAAVEAFLRERLPEHLVPRRWVRLDAIPLLHSGKVDRRALPAPAEDTGRPRQPLATDAEYLAADAWTSVLEVSEVFASDDFFALGGHSFAAVRVAGRLREALGLPVPVRLLFDHPRLADFAAALESLLLATL
jgi:amino acid adenylation domain-containing protein